MRFGRLVATILVATLAVPALGAYGAGVGGSATVTTLAQRGYPIQVGTTLPDPTKPVMTIDDIVRAINSARTQVGLPAMQVRAELTAAAQQQATYMASIQRTIHTGPTGEGMGQRLTQTGFKWTQTGEFIAGGFDDANAMVAAWLLSPGHRDLVLGNFTYLGVGLARDRAGMAYVSGVVANG